VPHLARQAGWAALGEVSIALGISADVQLINRGEVKDRESWVMGWGMAGIL